MRWTTLLQLLYGIPGVFIYFIVICAMIRMRKLISKSFLVIFMITASINIATWLNSWISLRLRTEPSFFFFYEWAAGTNLFRNTLNFLIVHFYAAQNTCVLLMTFDRFAVIYSVTRDTMWWSKYYLSAAVAAHFLCLILDLATTLPLDGEFRYNRELNFYQVIYDTKVNYNIMLTTKVQLGFGIVVFLLCLVLNILSLRQLIIIRRTASVAKEISMFLISFCIFLAQVLNLTIVVLYSFIFVFDQSTGSPIRPFLFLVTEIQSFTSDVFSIGPAFYTLLLPGPVRRYLTHKLKTAFKRFYDKNVVFVESLS